MAADMGTLQRLPSIVGQGGLLQTRPLKLPCMMDMSHLSCFQDLGLGHQSMIWQWPEQALCFHDNQATSLGHESGGSSKHTAGMMFRGVTLYSSKNSCS